MDMLGQPGVCDHIRFGGFSRVDPRVISESELIKTNLPTKIARHLDLTSNSEIFVW